MRVCAGCNADYAEEFNFCPHCGRSFGGGDDQTQRLNAGLRNLARAANRESSVPAWRASGNALLTDNAREGANVLMNHDPLFASMVEDE
jgi:hypothetical protein